MRTIYVLVGNIASGKSSYIRENLTEKDVLISRDNIRKQFARCISEEYIYDNNLENIINSIVEEIVYGVCYLGSQNIFIDETNMTKDTREMFIEIGKEYNYKIKAIVFPNYGEDIHVKRRLKDNHGDITEETWRKVYRENQEKFELPTKEEGFDEIIYV